jgi:hypothetical protein
VLRTSRLKSLLGNRLFGCPDWSYLVLLFFMVNVEIGPRRRPQPICLIFFQFNYLKKINLDVCLGVGTGFAHLSATGYAIQLLIKQLPTSEPGAAFELVIIEQRRPQEVDRLSCNF